MTIIPTTVTTESNRIDHDPDGIEVSFPYDFQVDSIDLMVVFADGVQYLEPFTMTGLGDPLGGEVIFDTPPLEQIEVLTLMRIMPLTQEKVYPVYGPFPAKSHENALDKLTWIAQQLQETLNRAWKNPVNNPGAQEDFYMPPPDAGKVLAWTADEKGLENQPGIGTFTALADQSEQGAVDSSNAANLSAYYTGMAEKWAQEDVDVPVDDGIHPTGFSAYHWAVKAGDGGLVEIQSGDPLMLGITTPQERYRSINPIVGVPGGMVKIDPAGKIEEGLMPVTAATSIVTDDTDILNITRPADNEWTIDPITNVANGMPKLDSNGKILLTQLPTIDVIKSVVSADVQMLVVDEPTDNNLSLRPLVNIPNGMVKLDAEALVPLDQMPVSGALTYIAAFEGHNRCPKQNYGVPESACVEPDTRNPSERFTSYVPESGHIMVVVACDDEPALNQINLLNPDTGLYELMDVTNGDATIYADGTGGLPIGWYLYTGFASQTVLASDVVFDDTGTAVKGDELQTFNQNMDTLVASKFDKSGGEVSGNIVLRNNVRLSGENFVGDALASLIVLGADDIIRFGESDIPSARMRFYSSRVLVMEILSDSTTFSLPPRYAPAPVNVADLTNKAYVDGLLASTKPATQVSFDDSNTTIKGVNVQVWNQAADAAIAGKLDRSGGQMNGAITLANGIALRGRNVAGDGDITLAYIDGADRAVFGQSDFADPETRIHLGAVLALQFTNGVALFQIVPRYAPAPVNDADLANKAYVDAQSSGGGAGETPVGGIIMYSGLFADIPANWSICDGGNGTPNLGDRFIKGTITEEGLGVTGGSEIITEAMLPAHAHDGSGMAAGDQAHDHGNGDLEADNDNSDHEHNLLVSESDMSGDKFMYGPGEGGTQYRPTETDGAHSHNITGRTASETHTHPITGTTGEVGSGEAFRPLYYNLAYIMRTS
ncbi:MAG: hypothetical protein DRJ15_01640 [Bacteroidetes bacterium]|nr:MAG: hypothetical protein DRJ15_01640 [Bacteroidota bacterium]